MTRRHIEIDHVAPRDLRAASEPGMAQPAERT